MAAKKKTRTVAKRTKKVAKKPVKRAAKAAARKPAAKTTKKAKRTKAPVKAKAAAKVTAKGKPAKKAVKSGRGEFGEGNYKASKRFREEQEGFVKTHRSEIPAMGKAAEDALDGPEGKDLRAAEAEAAGHAAGGED